MPIGGLLKCASRLKNSDVISRACDKLNSYRQISFDESTRHRESRQAAEVADSSQRIGKSETCGEI